MINDIPDEQSSRGRDLTRDPLIRAFGAVLRNYRESAGLSRAALARALGCTPQWIEKMETADKPPSRASAEDLDSYFKVPEIFFAMWKEIKRAGRRLTPPPGFEKFAELEQVADMIRVFGALLISGLFQTDAYARALLGSLQPPELLDQAVADRMERQKVLTREKPPRVWYVVEEWVLRRIVGDREIMREQLNALLEVSHRSNVVIQVLPHDTEHYIALTGSFFLLGFRDAPDVAYIEAAGQGNLITAPDAVTDCVVRYDLLRGHALPVDESRKLIKSIMESL
jgi:transcriptional regulator with XRE-family HTH domain